MALTFVNRTPEVGTTIARLCAQTVSPAYDEQTTYTFKLDGGPVVVNFTNTGPLLLYILSPSADCATASGLPNS